uniref:Uncharacterized protein n=1 Tax=Spermophilus dauricus TaxID=99837 RepID=A0A8C9P086_SPEDA
FFKVQEIPQQPLILVILIRNSKSSLSKACRSPAQWGTPVIPAAWEAKAGGSQVQSQPQQLGKTLNNLVRSCL